MRKRKVRLKCQNVGQMMTRLTTLVSLSQSQYLTTTMILTLLMMMMIAPALILTLHKH